jgi:hypothetical protein
LSRVRADTRCRSSAGHSYGCPGAPEDYRASRLTGNRAGEHGEVAQVLHVGSYADEKPTILALHAFIAEQGLAIDGQR